ncbi:phospholipase B1, membrane-associated [Mytilus galloprovincialis]|uniref:Phospholipase B1, membrane-associated n=1 Tax=Mytilus galloprovincialis TaxID=29158 RepID=A0A8B6DZI3_MYTGA|nr:phospholipase B1, membrane-associated [Mytilus galloprovincialis]
MKLFYILCSALLVAHTLAFRYDEYKTFIEQQSKNATFVKLFDQHVQRFKEAQLESKVKLEFPCQPFQKPKEATNVHELTPYDIKAIGAIGDSITAGTGITAGTIIGVLREDRGLSWSGGGDGNVEEYITLPNMIKRYNPDLKGYATGWGPYWFPNAHLNVAIPGKKASDMPDQARMLVDRLKSEKGVDYQNDWKVITLFIGGNDLCDFCEDREAYSAENYIGYIREALDIFHAEVPRAFVNLVEVLNIGFASTLREGFICDTIQLFSRLISFECSFGISHLVFMEDGSTDLSYFSPDCFHLSVKGQEAAAYALWDNMIEPVGQKRISWRPGVPVECPDEQAPYFYTRKNSPKLNQLNKHENLQNDIQENEPENAEKGSTMRNSATITGAVLGVICLVAAVCGTVYHIRKKRQSSSYLKI